MTQIVIDTESSSDIVTEAELTPQEVAFATAVAFRVQAKAIETIHKIEVSFSWEVGEYWAIFEVEGQHKSTGSFNIAFPLRTGLRRTLADEEIEYCYNLARREINICIDTQMTHLRT